MSVPVLVRHDYGCSMHNRAPGGGHSDSAKRFADCWNLHRVASGSLAAGQWIAVKLADGSSDGVLYASRRAAVAYQHHDEQFYAFVRLMPSSMSVCQAASLLRWHREAYDRGWRLPDPEDRRGGPQIIRRLRADDHERQLAAIATGAGFVGLGYN